MQRLSPVFLSWLGAVLALYVSSMACATAWLPGAGSLPGVTPQPAPAPLPASAPQAAPAPQPGTAPQPVTTRPLGPTPLVSNPVPHIALLLPLQSRPFARAAKAVQEGVMAAASLEAPGARDRLPVRVYGYADENADIIPVYRHAIAAGARGVIGPLTRNGVETLAAEEAIPVPTLALNVIDRQPSGLLFFFGMDTEGEAKTIARLARQQGLRQAVVIAAQSPLAQRLQFAFEEEWRSWNGTVKQEIPAEANPAFLRGLAVTPDTMVFLATDTEQAHLIRPYLPIELPVFATSQIFAGNSDTLTNNDLNGIHFVDMPWLLEPTHPAVMIYPRADPPLGTELERFYALGIDAFRLVRLMVANKLSIALPLDGVTGQIQLHNHTFRHTPIPAIFTQGHAVPTDDQFEPLARAVPDEAVTTP